MKSLLTLFLALLPLKPALAADVLIVADEWPAMQVLASNLFAAEKLESQIVWQTNLPARLTDFRAVVVYIHRDLAPRAERAFIDYTRGGGRLIALHHSISSGKRKNAQWFKFLGIDLPQRDLAAGGYKWIEGVKLDIVQLAPPHWITSHAVRYPEHVAFSTNGSAVATLAAFPLEDSEVYLNHVLTEPRTQLLGLRYTDAKSRVTYMQTHAGWVRPAGQGWIVYLMPGHSVAEFRNPAYARIVANAVVWKP